MIRMPRVSHSLFCTVACAVSKKREYGGVDYVAYGSRSELKFSLHIMLAA
jgi:hypothetical protein